MKKYNIPPSFKKGFIHLSQITNEQLNAIINILKETQFGTSPDKIIDQIVSRNIHTEEAIVEIMKAILSLFALRADDTHKPDKLVEDLISAFKDNNLDSTENELNNLAINLHELLYLETKITHTLKAFNLLAENDKIFLNSRILSDIRIVFDDDLSKEIKAHGTVVLHQLKINYKENQESKSIFFALDINDLNNLKEQIERAILKHRLIENNSFSLLPFVKTEK